MMIYSLTEKCGALLVFVQLFEEHDMGSRLRREQHYMLPVLLVSF